MLCESTQFLGEPVDIGGCCLYPPRRCMTQMFDDMTSVGVVEVRRRLSRVNRKSATHIETYWTHAKFCFKREGMKETL